MAPLPRKNSILDRLDSRLGPAPRVSPAMANAPAVVPKAKMPLPNRAAQAANVPAPPGIDNKTKQGPVAGAVWGMHNGQVGPQPDYTKPVVSDATGLVTSPGVGGGYERRPRTGAMKPPMIAAPGRIDVATDITGARLNNERDALKNLHDRIAAPRPAAAPVPANPGYEGLTPDEVVAKAKADAVGKFDSPTMPSGLSPQDQETWAFRQREMRSQGNQDAVSGQLSGQGQSLGPDAGAMSGMAIRRADGSQVQGRAGGSGRPLDVNLGADGRPIMVNGNPSVSVRPDPEPVTSMTPEQVDMRAAGREKYEHAEKARRNRVMANLGEAQPSRLGIMGGSASSAVMDSPSGPVRSTEQLNRMDRQRADSSNPTWEAARQRRIAKREAAREIITKRAVEDANNRSARLTARKGGLMETAFQGMDPDQQVAVMTGGRSQMGGSRAQDEYYMAQARAADAQTDMNKKLADRAAGGAPGAPGDASAPPTGSASPGAPTPKGSLGVPPDEDNMARGLKAGKVDIRDPDNRKRLQEWAMSDPDPENRLFGGVLPGGMSNMNAAANNRLRTAIRSGNWAEAQRIIDETKERTPPGVMPSRIGPVPVKPS